MKVFRGIDSIAPGFSGCSVTLGVFDGLHRAHQAIIKKVVAYAQAHACPSLLITFDPHPRQVLPDQAPVTGILTGLNEKLALLEQWDLDGVLVLPTNPDLLNQPAEDFVRELLVERLHVRKVTVGYDCHFGRERQGNAARCVELGTQWGFEVEVVSPLYHQGELVKSSTIRRLLTEGKVELANALLGYPYSLSGRVVKGTGRGRQLGFPTANLKIEPADKLIPARGVYLARSGSHFGMVNIGTCQTFGGQELSIELHLLNYTGGELYGRELTLSILERLRDEKRFPAVQDLVHQLEIDREICLFKMKNYEHEMEVINQ